MEEPTPGSRLVGIEARELVVAASRADGAYLGHRVEAGLEDHAGIVIEAAGYRRVEHETAAEAGFARVAPDLAEPQGIGRGPSGEALDLGQRGLEVLLLGDEAQDLAGGLLADLGREEALRLPRRRSSRACRRGGGRLRLFRRGPRPRGID